MGRNISNALLTILFTSITTVFAQETQRQYLSGKGIDDAVPWEFFCSAGNQSSQWATLPVPSCWDVAGFGILTYGQLPKGEEHSNEQGKYRCRFSVPAAWNDRAIFLVFEGSMTDTQAWVNGQNAGPMHQGAFYRFKYDVTRLVKIGEQNLLEVTVDKESANASVNRAERRGDYWNYGGIFRPVYLEASPVQHVERVTIDARADGSFTMDVFTSGVTDAGRVVRAQIVDAEGKPIGQPVSEPLALPDDRAKIQMKVDSPRLWTAETPNLYDVDVTLLAGDKPLHHVRQRFGFRTIEVKPGEGLFVNGRRIMLKGTDRHSFWPESGRATSERLSRLDVGLMKEMNNNAVRMSHYPPDQHFLDACDELGIYVLDELAGWHQSYDTPTGQRLIEAMVARDVNHPCILFWDNGNEGGWNTANDDEFARWDPQQRHVLHPWQTFRGVNTKHYPVYDLAAKLVNGPDLFFPTEFQHALFDGGGGAGLEDYWDVMRAGKASAGGIIWAFLDEAVKRKDRNGEMDTAGNKAPDGILGPYREKEGSFYTVKQVWSPIVVHGDPRGELTVENRYDFTNTDTCAFTWQLRKFNRPTDAKAGFTVIADGKLIAPSIAPHATGSIKLDLPPISANADAVALSVKDRAGAELWTWVWPLKTPRQLVEGVVGNATRARIIAGENAKSINITAGDLTLSIAKDNGQLIAAARGGKSFSLLNGPRLAVGDATLARIDHRADGDDCVIDASYSGNLKSVRWRIKPDGWVHLDYAYQLDGRFDFLGVSFDLPEERVQRMRWLGAGPYRVWKNRIPGTTLGVWENQYNNTMTGYSKWIYPEFKGYYADVSWMRLETTDGPITVTIDDPGLFVQVLRPEFPAHPKPFGPATAATRAVNSSATLSANAWATFPNAGFSILHGIAPIGTKFNIAQQLGPTSQQNVADGEYHGSINLFFGDAN